MRKDIHIGQFSRVALGIILTAVLGTSVSAQEVAQASDPVVDKVFELRIEGDHTVCSGDSLVVSALLKNLLQKPVWVDLQKITRWRTIDRTDFKLGTNLDTPIGESGRIKAWDSEAAAKPVLRFYLGAGAVFKTSFRIDTSDKFYQAPGKFQLMVTDLRPANSDDGMDAAEPVQRASNRLDFSVLDCS